VTSSVPWRGQRPWFEVWFAVLLDASRRRDPVGARRDRARLGRGGAREAADPAAGDGLRRRDRARRARRDRRRAALRRRRAAARLGGGERSDGAAQVLGENTERSLDYWTCAKAPLVACGCASRC